MQDLAVTAAIHHHILCCQAILVNTAQDGEKK